MENVGIKCNYCSVILTDQNWNKSNKKKNYLCCAHCNYLQRKRYKNSKKENETKRIKRLILKLETLLAYGNKCVSCGEDQSLFLTLDHINNNGHLDRKKYGAGIIFYNFLKEMGFPQGGLQILCHNCNAMKEYSGTRKANQVPEIYIKKEYYLSKEKYEELKEKALFIFNKLKI